MSVSTRAMKTQRRDLEILERDCGVGETDIWEKHTHIHTQADTHTPGALRD